MVIPSRSSTSGMQSIRRELQRRRAKNLAPKSSAANKSSLPLPSREGSCCTGREPCPRPPRRQDPSPAASKSPPASAVTNAPLLRAHPSPRSAVISPSTPPRSAPSSAGSACRASSGAAAHLKPGTAVGVRTRTTKLKTGKVLVLWLRATVVSATHQGYEVVYDGNFPPSDPYGTVHVPRRHVRTIKPSPSPMTPPPQQTPSSRAPGSYAFDSTATANEMQPMTRPTTAGKSLRLVRSLFPELERQARASLP